MYNKRWAEWVQTEEGKDNCAIVLLAWVNLQPNALDWILKETVGTVGLEFLIREHIPKDLIPVATDQLPKAVEIQRRGLRAELNNMVKEIAGWDDPFSPKCEGMVTPQWDKDMCQLCFVCSRCGVNYDRTMKEANQ